MQMIDQTVSKYSAQPESLNDSRVCRSIKVQVMDQLSDLLLQHTNDKDDTSQHRRRQILNRALEVVHEQREPLTLPELAAIIGTTPRTLQRAFKETLHISPLKYLRLSRMNAVQKMLLKGDKNDKSVTEVALDWGFKELGRFACEYKQLFGENPATTLARDAVSPAGDMYSFVRE
jgi:AraC family ethanolamine operon transcriptional activator